MSRKIFDKGYWASKQYYYSSLILYLWYSIRSGTFTWFSICNPKIPFGGMLDEMKTEVFHWVPSKYLPKTIKVKGAHCINKENLKYPIILKPDVGFKGYDVKKVESEIEFEKLTKEIDFSKNWIAQEFIDYNKEYSVLYAHDYDKGRGCVSSITQKEYPFIIGNGKTTIKGLLDQYSDPYLDKVEVLDKFENRLSDIPLDGKKVILHEIGNYSQGAKFYNRKDLIGTDMLKTMATLHSEIRHFDFFRIDCKADTDEDLLAGKFKILEINGMKSEPIHIYDSSETMLSRGKSIAQHWKLAFRIYRQKKKRMPFVFPPLKDGLKALNNIKKMVEFV